MAAQVLKSQVLKSQMLTSQVLTSGVEPAGGDRQAAIRAGLESLRPLRFGQSGYIFAISLDGVNRCCRRPRHRSRARKCCRSRTRMAAIPSGR